MWTNDIQLRNYLLGRLPDTESERLEEQLLENDEVFLTLRTIEDDLFDEYARDELKPDERDAFLSRYGRDSQRLAFASALARKRADVVAFAPRPKWVSLATAAALLVAVGTVLLLEEQRPRLSAPRTASVPVVQPVAITLTLGSTRGTAETPVVTFAPNQSEVSMRVRLNPADRYDRYRADLVSSTGATAFSRTDLHAIEEGGELVLLFNVPASSLPDGSYELAVHGNDEALGFTRMEVRRTR